MGRKLRHLLMFLLIILKEPNMPEADCSCAPSSRCDCSNRGLTSVPQNLPTSLTQLDLKRNEITLIQPGTFANLPRLQELQLYFNKIIMLQGGTFANLPRLQKLYLSNNLIAMIEPGAFLNLPKLEILRLHHNRITKIHPDSFAYLPQLQKIVLSANKITMIQEGSFANLARLKLLRLHSNRITKIQPGAFVNLPNLQQLYFAYNQITMIQAGTFASLLQLQILDLSYNQITLIQTGTFANLPRLQMLGLSDNQITMIQAGIFVSLPQLQVLWLSSNQITMIQAGAFANLPKLQHLYLINNNMSEIANLAFGLLPSDLVVTLVGNPWQCDCKMIPFRLDATGFPSNSFKDQIICVQPALFRGQKLKDISLEELACADTTISALPVDVLATCNNGYYGTTAGSTVGHAGIRDRTRSTGSSTPQTTSDEPEDGISNESVPNSPTLILIGSFCGSIAGIALIGTVILTIWYKRRTRNPPQDPSSGPNSNIAMRNLNMTGTVVTNDDYHTRQGQSQSITESNPNTTADVVTGDHGHPYEDMNQHNQAGQGQSQVIVEARNPSYGTGQIDSMQSPLYKAVGQSQAVNEFNPNTTATLMKNGQYHQYEDIDKQPNQTGKGQSQAITQSNAITTAAVVTGRHDHQYEDVDKHDQTGQGQSQANAHPLKVEDLSHNEVLAALKPNPMYAGVVTASQNQTSTEMVSGHNQTGQGQSQEITESNTNTTAAVVTGGHDHQYEDVDKHDQAGQGQSQAIVEARNPSYGTGLIDSMQSSLYKAVGQSQAVNEFNPNTTATLMKNGQYHQYEDKDQQPNQTEKGQSQAITQSNAITTAAVTGRGHSQSQAIAESNTNSTAAVVTSGHDYQDVDPQHNQTAQGQSHVINMSNQNTTTAVMSNVHDYPYEDMN
uniref:LRRCT domain-containing protein n=1 Tax=Branchiostoma floridae TaxID=7739 RepID=C3XWS4_BRAFL|eukprot:XP_002611174.1 hypothetical protein BRAFLDRAFT_88427 [Branchiostoma floridae]